MKNTYTLFFLLLSNLLLAQINVVDSLVHQTYQRKFTVHLPTGYNSATKRALVLNLHGGSGNMANAQGFSKMNPVADQSNFIVVYPQGYGSATPGYSWADGRNTTADQAGIDDIGFIDKLIGVLIPKYNIDSDKIYICGFSNGAFMVQRLACQSSERFAAMASLGCSMDQVLHKNCKPMKPVPMAFFNGTADPQVPYGGGAMTNPQVIPIVPVDSAVKFWVIHNKCKNANPVVQIPDTYPADGSTVEVYNFSNCNCETDVRFFRLINGGHTWPGVYIASQAAVLGKTNLDIQGSVEVWNFFSAHTLCKKNLKVKEDKQKESTVIFPNPCASTLYFTTESDRIMQYQIANLLGDIIIEGKVHKPSIDISNLLNGTYFIRLLDDIGETTTHKFVKM
ncbi:MAG: prolyl oligopeptidase family serine peptidase [Saprospiraceae bacterium]